MKRGPRPFDEFSDRLMPVWMIAQSMGISVRTVNYDLKRAINRLRFSFLLWRAYYGEVR